jgi:hypothetical protein
MVWFPSRVCTRIAAFAIALAFASACKKPAPALPPGTFTMADLAAASAFDAKMARLSLLSTQYKSDLTLSDGPALRSRTEALAPRLEQAAQELSAALEAIRNPEDRSRAARVAKPAARWPALLAATRDELLGPGRRREAADALAAADEQTAQALVAYRSFRTGWRIADAPEEAPQVVEFLRGRRELEALESRVGARLPAGPATAVPLDPAPIGAELEAAAKRARAGLAALDEPRRAQAAAWIDAQETAIRALLALAAETAEERRAKASLEYQAQKVAALEATAEYTRLTARRTGR